MVSPLSSRILNAEAKANINGRNPIPYRPLHVNVVKSLQMQRKRGVSGYSADHDISTSGSPIASESPTSTSGISLNMHKEERANHVEAQARRKRIAELNYQAFNVKSDLSKAGVTSLPFIGRQKALPPGSVDMSTTELIIATKDSPYYHGTVEGEDANSPQTQGQLVKANDISTATTAQDYSSMITSCQYFYNGPVPPTPSVSEVNNIARSVADSRTTASCPSSITSVDSEMDLPELPAKFQEVANANDGIVDSVGTLAAVKGGSGISGNGGCCSTEQRKLFDFITSMIEKQETKSLTIEDALNTTESARLIVENAPSMMMNIVHANAAFYNLMKIQSSQSSEVDVDDNTSTNIKIIGNSVSELIKKHSSHNTSSPSLPLSPEAVVNIRDRSFALKTYPIRAQSITTHYSLELSELKDTSIKAEPTTFAQLVG